MLLTVTCLLTLTFSGNDGDMSHRLARRTCCEGAGSAVATSASMQSLLDALTTGSDEEAANALIALTQEASALPRNCLSIMNCVPQMSGMIDVDLLERWLDDSLGRGRRFRPRGASTRRAVVLRWLAELIWYLPEEPAKEETSRAFAEKVEALEEAGAIDGDLALDSIFVAYFCEHTFVRPDISVEPVWEYLLRRLPKADGRFKDDAFARLYDLSQLFPSEVFALLEANYPPDTVPPSVTAMVEWQQPARVTPVSRRDYEAVLRARPEELGRMVRREYSSYRSTSVLGGVAFDHLVYIARRGDSDARQTLLELMQDGVRSGEICVRLVDDVFAIGLLESEREVLGQFLAACRNMASDGAKVRGLCDAASLFIASGTSGETIPVNEASLELIEVLFVALRTELSDFARDSLKPPGEGYTGCAGLLIAEICRRGEDGIRLAVSEQADCLRRSAPATWRDYPSILDDLMKASGSER